MVVTSHMKPLLVFVVSLLLLGNMPLSVSCFLIRPGEWQRGLPVTPTTQRLTARLFAGATSSNEIASMRIREIQDELKRLGVSFADCFDRDSLTQRLQQARQNENAPVVDTDKERETTTALDVDNTPAASNPPVSTTTGVSNFDAVAVAQELRSMRVSELRTECGRRNIRWAGMFEKEDLVQALMKAREAASIFSANIIPGQVGELTDVQLEEELKTESSIPLVLDVYATWCGPCKLMAPELVQAAAELGDKVRVAKIDSDQYPDWSRKLKIGAFPTILVFRGDQEVQRMEGALMKNQILNLVQPYIV